MSLAGKRCTGIIKPLLSATPPPNSAMYYTCKLNFKKIFFCASPPSYRNVIHVCDLFANYASIVMNGFCIPSAFYIT